ncbi:LysR family transcriptional regulator [Variovorax sp. WS11]|uniref:LysR family transcriptional regulator n=1 Tax=Variovorax sp. WS11 TaxID=1105204 RepID=UPI0013D92729|nr:LysR family transcriptional regulator [Variovorax sp. WS11]NDZ14534.1 LysR family transcriptional regulator [Variovorax sp. WS11]
MAQPAPISRPGACCAAARAQWVLLALLDQHRNLGRAAAAMSISQPAATKLLQQLEETFAVPLFTRVARGMTPTPYGEALVRHARWVLTDFDAVCQEVEALRSGLSGALRIGSVPGAVPELLAPALVAYQKQHERVAVSVVVDTSDVMLRQLARGEVDLMLGRLTEDHSAEAFDCAPLLGEPQVVVVRKGHPLCRRKALALRDLVDWPWLLQPPGSPQRGRFEAALREAGIQQRLKVTETASPIAMTALLEHSDMAAVMPASQAAHYGRLGLLRVLPVELPIRVPPIYLITRRAHSLSPAAAAFIALLRPSNLRGAEPPSPQPSPASGRGRNTRPLSSARES